MALLPLLLEWAALLVALSAVRATEEAPLVAVYAVRGQTALLPCNLTAGDLEDPVILVLWYKNGTKTPVFSMDSRKSSPDQRKRVGESSAGQRRAGSSRASDVFQGRAALREEEWSYSLMVRQVGFSDEGEYRCRLDFQASPTHNARVRLHVVELPKQLRIYSHGGALVDTAAAVQEAHPLTLSCRATGGVPLPNVTWWSGAKLLDSTVEERQEGGVLTTLDSTTTAATNAITTLTPISSYVTNTLHIAAVTRYHLTHNLTCKAANTPVFPPLAAPVLLTQTDSRPKVKLRGPNGRLSGGRQYRFTCESMGARPPPVLSWWLAGQLLTHNIEVRSPSKDSTVSQLSMVAAAADDGAVLECRSAAPTLPHLTSSDSTRLTVHYVPEASISLMRYGREGESEAQEEGGSREEGDRGLRAGDSATLTCTARANPPAYNFTFMFNGRPLNRADVVGGGRSLRLLHLTHRDAGLYTCVASNPEGDGQSNAVALHIEYAPVCEWEGVREVMAVVGEIVEMECRVRASPPHVSYTWESTSSSPLNVGQIRVKLRHEDEGLRSIGFLRARNISVTSTGRNRGQTAECHAENDVGTADHPCLFSILLIEQPSTLIGCYYHDVTTDSAGVTCSPGASVGQLPETYHIEVREGGVVVAAYNNTEPRFNLTSLAPGRDYVLAMFASHARGRGHQFTLVMKTHTPKAEQVAPERVRPANLNKGGEVPPQPTESPRNAGVGAPVGILVSGVVGVVVGVAVVVTGVVICRARQVHASPSSSSSSGKGNQYLKTSGDPLIEVPQSASFHSAATSPSCEMMTTFASGPVVVTQVTPARRSSTRSLHGRPSTRGGPVQVVEVEADGITTPTVEIESPSRSRVSLRGSGFTPSDSSTSSVRFDLHQKNESEARTEPLLASSQSHPETHGASEHPLQIPTVALTQEMPNIQLHPTASLNPGGTLPRPAKPHTTTLPQTAILHTALPPPPHTITYNPSPSHPTANPSNIPHVSLTIPHLQSNPESPRPVPPMHGPSATLPRNLTLSRLASQVHSAPDPQDYTRTFISQPLSVPQEALHTARGLEGSQDAEQHSQARLQPPRDPREPGQPPGTHTLHQHSTLPENISIKLHSTFR
ncbi:hypothetical protein O3P69_014348 [Scylla paramamosain]|uniref:Uncharacterized protein n=2 Tax=Scylla paramamosain TaxID=85552 RepID=A0AAW0TC30_SCYPA